MISDPMCEPFWTMAEELDFSIGFHEGSTTAMPTVGVDRFEDRAARHMISHTMEMMLAAMSVIWGVVVDRHPRLRIAFLESGGGWIAPWLDRMDRHFDDLGFNDSAPKTRPSRAVSAQLLDLVRAGRGKHRRAGRLYRPAQDHVGDRLSASGRLLPGRAADDLRTNRSSVSRGEASGIGWRRDGVLQPALTAAFRRAAADAREPWESVAATQREGEAARGRVSRLWTALIEPRNHP
jgi:hypothetical protein